MGNIFTVHTKKPKFSYMKTTIIKYFIYVAEQWFNMHVVNTILWSIYCNRRYAYLPGSNLFGICELEMKILYGKKSFNIFKYTRSTGSTLESGDNKDTVIKSNNGIDGVQLQNLRSKVFFNYE